MSPISPSPGLPQALHGCGMVRMVSWGPNHSKTILETERMLINQTASPLTHISKNLPAARGSYPEKEPWGNS